MKAVSEPLEKSMVQRATEYLRNHLRLWLTSPLSAIYVFFSCLYLLTSQGRINTFDGMSMYAVTRGLGDRGYPDIAPDAFTANPTILGTYGVGGHLYSKYGIGQSLAELPLYLVGRFLSHFAGAKAPQLQDMVTMFTNPLIMAGCCVAFYALVRALGYRETVALWATFILGMATSFWPYSKSDFSDPLLTLCFTLAAYGAVRAAQQERAGESSLRFDVLAGAALGFGALTKYIAVAFVPFFLLYMVLSLRHYSLRTDWKVWVMRFSAFLIPLLIAGVLLLGYNDLRFGSLTTTGYAAGDHPFNGSLWQGLWGLLLSPYRGLLFYDPLLFAGLLAFPFFLWRRRREALIPLGILVMSLVVYAPYLSWDAGPAWGPRYLVPTLPFLLLPLIDLGCFGRPYTTDAPTARNTPSQAASSVRSRWQTGWQFLQRHALQLGAGVLVVVSVGIQILGVTMNFILQIPYWQAHYVKTQLNTSPLALSIWTFPANLRFTFTDQLPGNAYAPVSYPFGPPLPPGKPPIPPTQIPFGSFDIQYFWFTLLPHRLPIFFAGLVLLGGGMTLAVWRLWRLRNGRRTR